MRKMSRLIGPGSINPSTIYADLLDSFVSAVPTGEQADIKVLFSTPIEALVTFTFRYYRELYHSDLILHIRELKEYLEGFADRMVDKLAQAADLPEAEATPLLNEIVEGMNTELQSLADKITEYKEEHKREVTPGLTEEEAQALREKKEKEFKEEESKLSPEERAFRRKLQEQEILEKKYFEDVKTLDSEISRFTGLDQFIDNLKARVPEELAEVVDEYAEKIHETLATRPEMSWGESAQWNMLNFPELKLYFSALKERVDEKTQAKDRSTAEEALQYFLNVSLGERVRMLPTHMVKRGPEGLVEYPMEATPGRNQILEYPDLALKLAEDVDHKFSRDTWDAVKDTDLAIKYVQSPLISDIPAEIKDQFTGYAVHPEVKMETPEKLDTDTEFFHPAGLITKHSEFDKTKGAWEVDKTDNMLHRRKTLIAHAVKGEPVVPYNVGENLAFVYNGSMLSGTISKISSTAYTMVANGTEYTVAHENVFDPGLEGMF